MKGLQKINLILLLFCVVVSAAKSASNNSNYQLAMDNYEVARLWQTIDQVYNNTQSAVIYSDQSMHFEQAKLIFSKSCDIKHPGNTQAQALNVEAQQLKSNHGISFRGGYTSDNLADQTGDPNAYLELSWDLWKQGYSGNRHHAQSLEHKASIANLRAQLAQQKLNFRCRSFSFNQTFSGLLSHLLTLKLALMEPVNKIEKRAYFKSWSYLDDLLVSDEDIRLLRQELEYLHSDPYRDSNLSQTTNLPVIDIDIKALVKLIRSDERLNKINSLEKQALAEKNKYRDNDRLRVFLRKQFDVGNSNDDGVIAGVRFSIPLEKKRKLAEEYRLSHIDQQTELETWEKITRTRAAYQSLREQLQRTVKQQYRTLRSHERLRRTLIEKKYNQEVQIATAVSRLRSNLNANIELVRAKEELYRRVNQVFLIAGVNIQPSLLRLTSLQENSYRARQGERSIYLWSKGFNQYGNDKIFDFLKAKSINRVLLTAGQAVNREKMQRFIKEAISKQIKVESIIGPNKLFFKEHHQSAALAVEAATSLSDAIHLDIEPHTFPGYKQNKAAYLNQYIDMLRAIRKQSPDVTLTVAVPFHWPERIYTALNTLVDRIYIMAYGSTKPDTIVRRLQPALNSLAPEKIVTVLRITDFSDEWEIEKMIATLQQRTGTQKFSLHTFRRFVDMAGKK